MTINTTLIGFTAIVLWGALALFTSLTGGLIPPFQLMAMTFTIAFALMLVRWLKQGHMGLRYIRQPLPAWLLMVGAYFGYHFCYFLALASAPVVEASLIAYLWPLLIVLFAALLPGERLLAKHFAGAVLALFGCYLIVGQGGAEFNWQYLNGYLLALVCAFIWSGFSVASRFIKHVPTDAVGWFCLATALLALFAHLQLEQTVWPLTSLQWAGVIGLGLGPVGIAFFTWDHGVKHGNLPLLGVLAYAAPLISVVLLVLFGQAMASWNIAFACVLIVGGSLLAGWKKQQQSPREHSPSS